MDDARFSRRVLIATAVAIAMIALAALLWRHPEVPLLLFGAILGAIFVDALARPLMRLGASRALGVALVALLLLAASAGAGWLVGPQIYEQGTQLVEQLPQWIEPLRGLAPSPPDDAAPAQGAPLGALPRGWQGIAPYVFGSLSGVFSSSLAILGGAIAGIALALFLALQPELYRDGALMLLPERRRGRVGEVLGAIANALRWWMVGRAVAMGIVALLTAVSLAALGMPLVLTLALIAGVLTFVPYVGPVLAAVPAILVALTVSMQQAVLVAALYWVIQLIENYVVTPVVQGRALALPPVLLILSQVAFGVLLGGLGLVLATPIAVALIVILQALYVQDVLGEPVRLLGEHDTAASRRPRFRKRQAPPRGGRLHPP